MKVLITGYGRMGKLIENTLVARGDEVVDKIDIDNAKDLETLGKVADIIIDFSNPSLTESLVKYADRTSTPLLSGTTNLGIEQQEAFSQLAGEVPVIWASNYSLGINLFMHILPQIKSTLQGWDVEITETHHNKKVDAPSGTAKSLADAIDPAGEYERVYGRSGNCGERDAKEMGMHALRGGTVAGEHTVGFFGNDEIFEISHKAASRQIFVDGAVAAAHKLVDKKAGLYTMEQLLFG